MNWFGLAAAAGLLAVGGFVYLFWYFRWEARQTAGIEYFGRTLAHRRALKQRIRLMSLPALPVAYLLSPLARKQKGLPSFEFQGVHGPMKASSPDVFARAVQYQPRPEDVFVATQMRCGTTWMQQIVHQVVTKGRGDFRDDGVRHLNVMSPWIDGLNSVSMDAAPLIGDSRVRIVKTHLPSGLCPWSAEAKYIYVARHPVSCFASVVDYYRTMVGPFLPPAETLAEWFCSDKLYWGSWPRHVDGYWRWAQEKPNVLFVHFEEMTSDFGGVLDRVASFLGQGLSADDRARVTEHCTFKYMQAREEWFEMAPPTMFSVREGRFLASGRQNRHEDVTPVLRKQILDYCRAELAGASYPAARFYGDLA